jgi:hypothetical protein
MPAKRDHAVEDGRGGVPVGTGRGLLDDVLELVVNRARVDRVDPDAARRQFGGDRSHQPDLCVLSRRVAGDVRGRGEADHARGEDDRRAVRQVGHGVLGEQEGAADVHRERLVEGILRIVGDRPGRTLDPRVGHHDIESAEPLDRRLDRRLDLGGVGDIRLLPRGAIAEFRGALPQALLRDAREKDPRSLGGHRTGRRHADGPLAAGDDGDLAV